MSRAEVSRRLKHAKTRGFRTGLAFAEGLLACDGAKAPPPPAELLARSRRTGPDVLGKAVVLNPCHEDVRERLAGYHRALMEAHGAEIDALVWFETADVPVDALGPSDAPGYAARELMRLVRDFAGATARARPGVAFLAGDALDPAAVPCALGAQGCIPAGGWDPGALHHALFPNLRNVLWPLPRGKAVSAAAQREVVARFGAPVATSCGWGDAPGWAQMEAAERNALLLLFRERASRPQQLRWLAE
jgi:hypothetical protein